MRLSKMFLPTLREVPSEAEVISHQLMLRAAMIRRLASGIYSYLPLGLRVIRKIERIIREEMDAAGALETLLPAVQPAELWQESGRWDEYGKELLRFLDRSNHGFCFGPTHEEVVTDLVRGEVRSYRDLPLNLYQVQTKFRDEIRPRYGLMRAREFIMKDAYSFDIDDLNSGLSYGRMREAYTRIFSRCGLRFRAVEADSGTIGGSFSHEFMVLAETGEDTIASCNRCSYAANLEKAEVRISKTNENPDPSLFKEVNKVKTPGMRTIEEVTTFLGVKPSDVIKTLIFSAGEEPIAVLIRGDHEVNEAKLKAYLKTQLLELASPDIIESVTGAPVGFAGAMGLRIRTLADWGVKPMVNSVMGANLKDYHALNVNYGRDYKVDEFADLRVVQHGDSCPHCNGDLVFTKGIEVGHIFKLGDKYSKALNAVYLDANGHERLVIMGCYGIGVGRTAAAAIEQSHDEDGIIWPVPIAPYHALVLPIDSGNEEIASQAEQLYEKLNQRNVETLLDDRNLRPGIKFKDADLIGIPIRITIGPKHLKDGQVELRTRRDRLTSLVPVETAADEVKQWLQGQLTVAPAGSLG